jgi:hypothetical protein
VLVLGVDGTLSSWTSAIINNNHDTATATTAVALKEQGLDATGTPVTCDTSTDVSNTVTCAVDKYTGTTSLQPGGNVTADVTFTNVGTSSAATLTLAPGSCTDVANVRSTGSLCSDGNLTVALSCVDGSTYTGTAFTDLVFPATKPSALTTVAHTATIAVDAQITCRFTVALGAATPVSDSGAGVSQPLTWTLSQT